MTINELRHSNHAMQVAITSLSRIALRLGIAELNAAVHTACQAAGLVDTERPDSCDNGQAMDQPSAPPHGRPVSLEDPSMVENRGTQALNLTGTTPSSPPRQYHTPVTARTENGMPPQHQDSEENGRQLGYRTGRFSPRLSSYGLWPERPVFRLTSPPVDIIPYLGDNVTLSKVIFWTGMFWGFKLLRAALDGKNEATVTAHKVFGEIVPMKPNRRILNVIHAKLMFGELGYIASDHPGYDPDGGMRIQAMMAHTCAAKGTPLETFLRPDGVEDLLRSRLGEDYRVIELGLQGLGSSKDLARVRRLIDTMIRSSVCLGDGPRLRFDRTVKILETWSNNTTIS